MSPDYAAEHTDDVPSTTADIRRSSDVTRRFCTGPRASRQQQVSKSSGLQLRRQDTETAAETNQLSGGGCLPVDDGTHQRRPTTAVQQIGVSDDAQVTKDRLKSDGRLFARWRRRRAGFVRNIHEEMSSAVSRDWKKWTSNEVSFTWIILDATKDAYSGSPIPWSFVGMVSRHTPV